MTAPPNYQAAEPVFVEMPDTRYYKVEKSANHTDGCQHCGHDVMWTITYTDPSGEPIEIGTSWQGEEGMELAEDICELMNMAYEAGREASPASAESARNG